MKKDKNKVTISVHPNFKDLLQFEAKTKGMTIPKFTDKLASDKIKIQTEVDRWSESFKKHNFKIKKERRFDFL